jgi:hypothetical protein
MFIDSLVPTMDGSESAAISVKAEPCHGTITTAQRSLNGPDLANRR